MNSDSDKTHEWQATAQTWIRVTAERARFLRSIGERAQPLGMRRERDEPERPRRRRPGDTIQGHQLLPPKE